MIGVGITGTCGMIGNIGNAGVINKFPGGGIAIGIAGTITSAINAPLIFTIKFPLPWVGLSGRCGCVGRSASVVRSMQLIALSSSFPMLEPLVVLPFPTML